jgi:hypothetical protein
MRPKESGTFLSWEDHGNRPTGAVLCHPSAAEQVNNQYNECNYQQDVNQTAGYMEAEPQQPKNQKHNKNSPKHSVGLLRQSMMSELTNQFSCQVDLFVASSLLRSLFKRCLQTTLRDGYLPVLAGASVFPHSRHDRLARGVISPQAGHIRWVAYPSDEDVTEANMLANEARIFATSLARRCR